MTDIENNRATLFATYGRPIDSKSLGLSLRGNYNRKEWANYKPKERAQPMIINMHGRRFYEKGEVIYTTTGTLVSFSSVMNTNGSRREFSLHNAVTILRIEPDFTTSIVYPKESS